MTSPLGNTTYRRLFAAQVTALVGTGLSTVALALLAHDLADGGAGAVLGTALAIKMIAYVGIAPVAGAFAHRLPRKHFLIALDVARAGAVACLPFITEVWQVYVLIFAINACSAGFTPCFQATIPDILPDERQYTRALSLSRLAYDLESLLSPTLAALALVFVAYDVLFTANAAAFIVSALLIGTLSLPSPQAQERERGLWKNLSFGVGAYLHTPRLRGLLALCLAVSAAGAMVIVNTVVIVRERLGGTETDTALGLRRRGRGLDARGPPAAPRSGPRPRPALHAARRCSDGSRTARGADRSRPARPDGPVVPDRCRLLPGADPGRKAAPAIGRRRRPAGALCRSVLALARVLARLLSARGVDRQRVRAR